MVKGNKNRSCLYAKGPEGIGKSTLIDIIFEFVIGSSLCCKGKADHLKGQHNMQLLGKIFVPFEELQFFSDKEWNAIDSEIKDLITGDYASYTDKYEKRFDAKNTNNYIINSNFNAIKGANGRRYVVLDINPSYQNNTAFFKNIRTNCFNDNVGRAIYCYLCEVDTDNFNSLDIPETQNKLDIIADLMTPIEKFMKYAYIIRQNGMKDKLKTVYDKYVQYCTDNKLHHQSIQTFSKTLREYGIEYKAVKGYNVYDVSFQFLDELAKRKKWYHHLDKDVQENDNDDDPLEHGIDKNAEQKPNMTIEEQIKHYEEVLNQLYKKQLDESNKIMTAPIPVKKSKRIILERKPKQNSVLAEDASKFILEF